MPFGLNLPSVDTSTLKKAFDAVSPASTPDAAPDAEHKAKAPDAKTADPAAEKPATSTTGVKEAVDAAKKFIKIPGLNN